MNLQFRRWPRSLFALRLCKITDSYVTFNDRIDRSINYFSVKKVAIASTNTDTREQALDYTSVRRRIASSIRRSSARVSINTYRREEEVEKRHGSRRSFRFSKLTELVPSNEHIFIYRVPYASVKSSARRNTKCHLLGNIMPPFPVSSLSSPFTSAPRSLIIARSSVPA